MTAGLLSWVRSIFSGSSGGAQENDAAAQRVRAEEAEERFKLLTDNLAAAVLVRNAQGKILYCSPYTEILTGYPVSEIYAASGDFFVTIVEEEDRSKYIRSLQVSTHGEPFQFRYRFRHRTGIQMWAESRTVPILGDDGSVISSLSVTLDVTATVRHQRQIEEKNRELQDLTYMISHDLKAPIFTLKGMLEVLNEDCRGSLPPSAAEPLEHMNRAVNRLDQLVKSVLDYSRASSTDPRTEQVSLEEVLTEVTADFRPELEKIGGTVTRDGPLPTIIGDHLKTVQIISNLMSNAIKYHSPERPLRIVLRSSTAGYSRMCALEFHDNGCGIPPDKCDLVFRPFQRLHGKEIEGSGMGLACVKKLVERMNGDVYVTSDGATGSTFVLLFPAMAV